MSAPFTTFRILTNWPRDVQRQKGCHLWAIHVGNSRSAARGRVIILTTFGGQRFSAAGAKVDARRRTYAACTAKCTLAHADNVLGREAAILFARAIRSDESEPR